MWVFAGRLPSEARMVAPRGLYSTPLGGFGWHEQTGARWPLMADFEAPMLRLNALVEDFILAPTEDNRVHLVGFSQGAAMAYAFALTHPQKVASIAALSGFSPQDAGDLTADSPLHGKPVFITHGSEDELVPLDRARLAAEMCRKAGAQVTFCEDRVGHKLGASCYRGLAAFYQALTPSAWESPAL
jgi:phospholipase/carboxylesterase